MTFPDTVLVFQILERAGLNENQHQMAPTRVNDLTFKSVKGALKRVFSDKERWRWITYKQHIPWRTH